MRHFGDESFQPIDCAGRHKPNHLALQPLNILSFVVIARAAVVKTNACTPTRCVIRHSGVFISRYKYGLSGVGETVCVNLGSAGRADNIARTVRTRSSAKIKLITKEKK